MSTAFSADTRREPRDVTAALTVAALAVAAAVAYYFHDFVEEFSLLASGAGSIVAFARFLMGWDRQGTLAVTVGSAALLVVGVVCLCLRPPQ